MGVILRRNGCQQPETGEEDRHRWEAFFHYANGGGYR